MQLSEIVAKFDKNLRHKLAKLAPEFFIYLYSSGRNLFLKQLTKENPNANFQPILNSKLKIWDIQFNAPLFNAAGMFKDGKGYQTVAKQNAGAFLAGTTTSLKRAGNKKLDILHPFLPLPNSKSAINWMGLPNNSHSELAKVLSKEQKILGCPIAVSISADPDLNFEQSLEGIFDALVMFEKANIDFIELNESCPNVPHHSTNDLIDEELIKRLEFISSKFLKRRNRNFPVILKLSVDTDANQIPSIIDILLELGFDGLNLGNTSTKYTQIRSLIDEQDLKNFDFFIKNFGGGVSGNVLKQKSLDLSSIATKHLCKCNPKKEFHIIRTGGIENIDDIYESTRNGISLNQWFTGYFEAFSYFGHKLYRELFSGYE